MDSKLHVKALDEQNSNWPHDIYSCHSFHLSPLPILFLNFPNHLKGGCC